MGASMPWWKQLGVATVILASSLGADCELGSSGGDKAPGDADTDTDADSDADGDVDVDIDTDTDADAEPIYMDFDEDCDTEFPIDPLTDECVTSNIQCGETIYATNTGGSSLFTATGQFEQCSGSATGSDFDGPERVYKLDVPEGIHSISARVESCEDSWLLWYRESTACQPEDELVTCGYPTKGNFKVQYDGLLSGDGVVWFVVEGFQNDGGNFALHIDCFEEE